MSDCFLLHAYCSRIHVATSNSNSIHDFIFTHNNNSVLHFAHLFEIYFGQSTKGTQQKSLKTFSFMFVGDNFSLPYDMLSLGAETLSPI